MAYMLTTLEATLVAGSWISDSGCAGRLQFTFHRAAFCSMACQYPKAEACAVARKHLDCRLQLWTSV
eukprot:5688950-Amphidinium_carterae.1